jgi:hypothetical protein
MINFLKQSFSHSSPARSSTYTLQKTIRHELESLNRMIDAKIMRGLSYAREARKHKMLLYRLYNLNGRTQ